MLLLVNYHYIRDPDAYAYPGIHPISKQKFERQVDEIRDVFHMATPDEVESFTTGKHRFNKPSVLLTFDDGLPEHLEVAKDILEPRKICGAFFIITAPIFCGRAATVHKVHWLRAHTEPEVFAAEFVGMISTDLQTEVREVDAKAASVYPYDTPEVAQLKYAMNFRLPLDVVDNVTTEMLAKRGLSEERFCRQTYLDREGVAQLAATGHKVGAHGHRHLVFSKLNGNELDDELSRNVDGLMELTGQHPDWVSYPYGRRDALPIETAVLCERFGFKVGITLLGGWNDGSEHRSCLNRINTNEVNRVAFGMEAGH